MSEKIYAVLLRLYPARFRAKYAVAAMQLFCDRARDERGFFRLLRLWLDLLKDLVISLPRTYGDAQVVASLPAPQLQRAPAFQLLQTGGPRGTSILYATIFSLAVFVSLLVWIGHGPKLLGVPWTLAAQPAAQRYRSSRASAQPDVQDATQAMIQAIRTHQIVMFGEIHGNRQEYKWLCKLVRTAGFADRVDDIVVEFGNSLYQKSVDRYIAGEDVPFEQVQKAWRNMIGAVGPVSPVYGWFYEAVRESNLERRGGHQIRLLLGDPYGDWEKIKNDEDLGPYLGHRDQWYAQVVRDEVLAPHHHALLIMGAGHFLRRNGPGEVERAIRSAGVQPYLVAFGTNVTGGYDDLDPRFDGWRAPAIVTLSGNWVGDLAAMPVVSGGEVAANSLKMADLADAMLYLGPRDSLAAVNVPRSELVGTAYGKEVARRYMIQTGQTLEFTLGSEVPQFSRPTRQIVSNGVHLQPPNPPKSAHDPLPPRPPSQ
jgi:hypothetical protein